MGGHPQPSKRAPAGQTRRRSPPYDHGRPSSTFIAASPGSREGGPALRPRISKGGEEPRSGRRESFTRPNARSEAVGVHVKALTSGLEYDA